MGTPLTRMIRLTLNRLLKVKCYKIIAILFGIYCTGMFFSLILFKMKEITVEEPRDEEAIGYRPLIRFDSKMVEDKPRTINRIIHQTWKSANIPSPFKSWIKSWLDMNPEYEYWLWTDDDIRSLIEEAFPAYLDLFDSYPAQIYRYDAFRYFVLYEHGGIYADLDTSCLRPIDYQMAEHDCILTQEALEHAYLRESPIELPHISNAIMACRRRHPFFRAVIKHLPDAVGPWYTWNHVLQATGPRMLKKVWQHWQEEEDEDDPYLAEVEVYQPTLSEAKIAEMKKFCLDLPADDVGKSSVIKTQRKLCEHLLNPFFQNEPGAAAYTNHFFTNTWGGGTRGQSNETFNILSLKLN